MLRAAYPYARPDSNGLIAADAWMLDLGEGPAPAPVYISGWDYHTTLKLSREMAIELDALREATGLAPETPLSVVVSSFSTATWLRRQVFRKSLVSGESQVDIELQLPGSELGGNLQLRTTAILAESQPASKPFVAHLAGSILWEDRFEMRLQGDAPLFPISVVNFERAGFAKAAGWHLEIGSDLEAPLHASIRLYLNSEEAMVVSAFEAAGWPSPEQSAVLRTVYADVARVMVEHALNQEPLYDGREWNPDCLGLALQSLLQRYFPRADLAAIRRHRIDHPADFSTELLSEIRLFND